MYCEAKLEELLVHNLIQILWFFKANKMIQLHWLIH